MSSVSRRQLARRRQRWPRVPLSLLVVLAVIVVVALVFAAAHGF